MNSIIETKQGSDMIELEWGSLGIHYCAPDGL
jgi:hypothetical protein